LNCNYSTNPNDINMEQSLQSKLDNDYPGFKFGYMMTGHVKNMDAEQIGLLYQRINKLFASSDSAVAPLVKKNGWVVEPYTQEQIKDMYDENMQDLRTFLK